MQKKRLALLLSALVLTACAAQPPAAQPAASLPEPEAATATAQAPYNVQANPYNQQTATTGEYIFTQELGAIYRIDPASGDAVLLADNDTVGYRLPGPPSLAAFDGHVYFMAVKNIDAVLAEEAPAVETGIYRMDADGQGAAEVATLYEGIHLLFGYEGYLVAYWEYYEYLPPEEQFKIFAPDSSAESLTQIPVEEFEESWFRALDLFIHYYLEKSDILLQLGYVGDGTLGVSAIQANDAWYILDNGTLYRLPPDSNEASRVELTDEVAEYVQSVQRLSLTALANYDNDWLYVQTEYKLYRLRKDGSEYQECVFGGVQPAGRMDVTNGYVLYEGTNTNLYMLNLATGSAHSLKQATGGTPAGEWLEAVRIENDSWFLVSPLDLKDVDLLGEELKINPSRVEFVDEAGNEVSFSSIPAGARLTIEYTGYYAEEGWEPALYASKIIVHED